MRLCANVAAQRRIGGVEVVVSCAAKVVIVDACKGRARSLADKDLRVGGYQVLIVTQRQPINSDAADDKANQVAV